MGNPPSKSAEDKVWILLAVLRGEISIAAAARRHRRTRPARQTPPSRENGPL